MIRPVRVLGIDPGLRLTGFGCVEGDGVRPRLVDAGVIRLVRGAAVPGVPERLVELERDLIELLERTRPDVVAVERLFAHATFPATGIVMGHARGVILLRAASAGVPIVEVEPAAVKKAMTGHGRATKMQMQLAVQGLLGLAELPRPADIADAIGIGVCALRRARVAGVARLADGARRSGAVPGGVPVESARIP